MNLLDTIKEKYDYFEIKYGFITSVINKAYEIIYHNKEDNKEEITDIIKIIRDWIIDVKSNKKIYTNKKVEFPTFPEDFSDDMKLYGYESGYKKNVNYYNKNGEPTENDDIEYITIDDNISVDSNNEYSDKYSLFFSLIDAIYNSLNSGTQDYLDNYIKEYFYKTVLNKYYTKDISDNEFSKLELGEMLKALPKTYEKLDGDAGLINYSNTIYNSELKIRFDKVFSTSLNKKELTFLVDAEISPLKEIYSLLKKAEGKEETITGINLKEKAAFLAKTKICYITPFINLKGGRKLDGSNNFNNEELRITNVEIRENKLALVAEGTAEYDKFGYWYNEDGIGVLKLGSVKQRLLDNVVGKILSNSLVSFKDVGQINVIKNPNTTYDAEEYNNLFDDRETKIIKTINTNFSNMNYFYEQKLIKITLEEEDDIKLADIIYNNCSNWKIIIAGDDKKVISEISNISKDSDFLEIYLEKEIDFDFNNLKFIKTNDFYYFN